MPNITGLLYIGRNALLTQQKAIDITGNNIANVNTPGYCRQRLNMAQGAPIRDQNGTMSTGVAAQQKIQRFHDTFITAQLNGENESLGRWEAQKIALEKIEVLFDEVSGYGLSEAMSDYWNAWHDLTNNPAGHVERTSLLSAGQFLSTTFNQLSSNMDMVRDDINTNIKNTVNDINQMATQIAELNRKVSQVEVSGHNANDYRDQRDQLVYDLAKLIDIDSFEDGDGNVTVMIGGGKPLVESTFTWQLSTADAGGATHINWNDSSGAAVDITDRIAAGELKGWIYARDDVISDYMSRLDTLAGTIISEVNALHDADDALAGIQNPFFNGTDASNISVNSAIEADTGLIAANADPTVPIGDNAKAMAIAELQNAMTMAGGTSTFDDFYIGLVGDIGNDVRRADLNYDHQNNMIQHLRNYREEVSGVSLDEEMVDLIKFQHAYNAAARLITTTDEMMETIIAMAR
ncbi:MAG: hypothetical protein VR64_17015 [Desulfatitalea sp. BRH_c12]|nr:MAG: hypothetical protein VR64_17015 [Desulfatitalea sp. BRH_c12]